MNKLGNLIVGPVSAHDFKPDDPNAVASIYIYGSKGGFRDMQLIGQDVAAKASRDLANAAGVPENRFASLSPDEREDLAYAVAEWLQSRYGETGAYMLAPLADPTDDGWRRHAALLVELIDSGPGVGDFEHQLVANCRQALG